MSESKTPRERVAAKERESEACAPDTHAHYGWKCAYQLADELSAALQRAEKAEAELIDMEAKLLTYKAKYGELG